MGLFDGKQQFALSNNIEKMFDYSYKVGQIGKVCQKDSKDRSEDEIDRLIDVLKGLKFFKNTKTLNYSELRELSNCLTYE